jgi:hypothetical protein
MNISNFFIVLLTILTFSFNATASTITTACDVSLETKKVEGGPRTIIQNMTEVIIFQPTVTTLYITIISAKGELVSKMVASAQEIAFSTEEWDAGTYKIETTDDQQEYQEFYITVE